MEYSDIFFETEIPEDVLKMLFELGKKLNLDPISNLETERYFFQILSKYSGDRTGLREYLKVNIEHDFRTLKEAPRWLQASDWQFNEGKPMVFVGQLDSILHRDGMVSNISFYVFWDIKKGETRTVTQSD